jgi:hypothetical protein
MFETRESGKLGILDGSESPCQNISAMRGWRRACRTAELRQRE